MKLPADSFIAPEKLRHYLLTEVPSGDKSGFLAQAGYSLANPERLERDIREQILPLDAGPLPWRGFGDRFEIRGVLRGPSGVELAVRTIWMREFTTGIVKFITLIPLREIGP